MVKPMLNSASSEDKRKALVAFASQLSKQRSNVRLWLGTACLYGGLLLCFFQIANIKNSHSLIWWFLPLLVVIGWLQYAIVQAMHEAIHQVYKKNKLEYLAANILLFYAVGLKPSYRQIHLDHHKYFGSVEQDPDAVVYSHFPHSRWQLISHLLLNFVGLMAVVQLGRQHLGLSDSNKKGNNSKTKTNSTHFRTKGREELVQLITLCAVQLLILATFSWFLSWLDYVLFWLLPLFTIVKTLSYIRVLAEHGDKHQIYALRSFSASWAARYLWGPFGFAFHAEHHWFANIPYYKLPQLSAEIAACGVAPKAGQTLENLNYSHVCLIYRWFCQLPWRRS